MKKLALRQKLTKDKAGSAPDLYLSLTNHPMRLR